MNYKWTINLHDGYPLIHILPPEEHIPSFLHNLFNSKPTMFHLGEDHLCSHRILLPPGDNGENLEATVTVENESNDDLHKLSAPIGHHGPLRATNLNLKGYKYNVLDEWEIEEKTYEPTSVLAADNPVTGASYAKGNGFSQIDGWESFKNLAETDKHDLSSIASPKGERKRPFSWTSFSRVSPPALYVLVNLHLESPFKSSCCVVPHQALSVALHLQNSIKKLSFVSPSIFVFVTLLFILNTLCANIFF